VNPFWYPLCADEALTDKPLAVQLLGQALVLWRGAESRPVLQQDRCPHRGARLSLGHVQIHTQIHAQVHAQIQPDAQPQAQQHTLACPYHGWRFNAEGRCVHIPALPGFEPPASHRVSTFPVALAHGLIWGCVDTAAGTPANTPASTPEGAPPALPTLPPRHLLFGPFDVAVSAPRVVENFLDTAHFGFVHDGWLGTASHAEVPAYPVSHTADGRPVVAHYPAWQPRATASAAQGGWVSYRYEVLGPTSALLSKQPDDGSPGDSFTLWCCPTDDEHCRVWMGQYTADTTTSDEDLRTFQLAIFAQDTPVLESQQPKRLPLSGGELHCAADRLSVAYRRYLLAAGVRCGVC
jgi:phenylpropionate dioxygenase-like ring-hydroxylating dioxygenase large terminal subunit